MSDEHIWDAAWSRRLIQQFVHLPGALLPILHALQEEFGYIDKAAIPHVAEALNLSIADVHGVISFYHDFRKTPPGRHILRICRAEACQAMGSRELLNHIEQRLGIQVGQTAADGSITIESAFCLGNCALSPAIMLDEMPYGRVSPQFADSLIARAIREEGPLPK